MHETKREPKNLESQCHVAQSWYSAIGDKPFLYGAKQHSTIRNFVFTRPVITKLVMIDRVGDPHSHASLS